MSDWTNPDHCMSVTASTEPAAVLAPFRLTQQRPLNQSVSKNRSLKMEAVSVFRFVLKVNQVSVCFRNTLGIWSGDSPG